MPIVHVFNAQPAIKLIAITVASVCAAGSPAVLAQTAAQPDRNLVVQANAPAAAARNQRVALVIGNANYKEAPLANPVNDARAIGAALQESGFTVILRENTDQRGMLAALREFGDKLRGGGTGLFYYAGHGMQIKGRNYLIPVGANVDREDEVAYSAVDAQAVLDKMEAAGNAANIMILDACRNNPFNRSSRSGQAGLAQMDAPVGTLVAFATSPGMVASDGAGANGLYTQHLLTAMRQNGSKVEDVFKQVRANVRRDSQGKQVPWESTSMEGDFYFRGGASVATAAAVDSSIAVENALWDAVKNSTLPIELRAYLNRFPAGRYAGDARARLAQLQPASVALAPSAPTVARPVQAAPVRPSIPDASNDDQAAIDRRTEEILASLGAGFGQIRPVAATNPASTRPIPVQNTTGFTVGDRWRFQTVDKFKQEVVGNFARNVVGINADGSIRLNESNVDWTARGDVKSVRGPADRLREFNPPLKVTPDQLKAGYSENFAHNMIWRNQGAHNGIEEREGKIKVIGQERVKVPAGEFDAWRIESTGFANGKNLSTNGSYVVRFKEVIWYVPALRNFVASEYEQRFGNNVIDSFTRSELTSFSVRGANEALSQR
jgi:Caspase domain